MHSGKMYMALMVNKIDRPNTTPIGPLFFFFSLNDLPFLYERIGGSLKIFLSTG